MLAVLHTTPSAMIVAGKAIGPKARRATTLAVLKEEEARHGDEEVEGHKGGASARTIKTRAVRVHHSHPPKQCSANKGHIG